MKKQIMAAIIAAMTITAAAVPAMANTGNITDAQAKQIALTDAGLKDTDVTFVRCNLDLDDGRMEYEVEFFSGNTEFDYDIDAATGTIVSKDRDAEFYSPAGTGTSSVAEGAMTEQKALEIALNKAGVSKDTVSFSRVHRDFDDGREIFDVEFHVGMTEYSFDIDANTGAVVDYGMDYDD